MAQRIEVASLFAQFTKLRRRRFRFCLTIWSVGMFVLVPLVIILFAYYCGMPLEKWGYSPAELYWACVPAMAIYWVLGAIGMLLAFILNPLREDERTDDRQCRDPDKSGNQSTT